jgi:acyl-CoA thioester hydrolase
MPMIETFRGVAHPWLCDVMGHLNTRNYVALFDDASMHFISSLGYDFSEARAGIAGWADVHAEINLMSEVAMGALAIIRTGVIQIGNSSITTRHEMTDLSGEQIHASYQLKTVYFDLAARKSKPIPDAYRKVAEGLMIA